MVSQISLRNCLADWNNHDPRLFLSQIAGLIGN
jgi:hypothetical protein